MYFLKTGLSIDSDKFLVNKFGLDVALKNEMLQCQNKLMKNSMAVSGCGLVVSILTFCSNNPSSNTAGKLNFVYKKTK